MERQKLLKEIEKEDERAWEENRDKRVKQWRNFMNFSKGGKKRAKGEFKAPKVKMESRPASAPKAEQGRPLGIDETYKRQWK